MPPSRKEHLVDTALKMFYRDGFHDTGIDKILAESGVAKMTLYKHFRSKNDLILAVLRRRDEQFRAWFSRAVETRADDPRGRLLAIFDALDEWFSGEFFGCMFINASAEYTAADDPIHRVSAEHKRLILNFVAELAGELPVKEPDQLAFQLSLLIEGSIVTAHVVGTTGVLEASKDAASKLIDAA